jgi:hypothetical protein
MRRCLLKWYLTFILGFLSAQINKHFWLGGLVHYALSEYHLGRTTDAAHLFNEIGKELIEAERGVSITIDGEELEWDNVGELEVALELGTDMLERYQDWFKENEDFDVIDTELAYYIQQEDFKARPFTLVARLDRLTENSEGIRVGDFKTCADFRDQKWIDQDQQFRRYPWMVREAHPDWADDVVGSEWIGLRKIKESNRSKPPYFMTKDINLDEDDFREIERELRAEVTQLFDLEEKLREADNVRDVIYPNPMERCSWDCDYFSNGLCQAWRRGHDITEFGDHFGQWGVDPYIEYKDEWETAVPVVIGRREEGGH